MRVSDFSFFRSNTKNVKKTLGELFQAQEEVSTGIKVRKPSDDPLAASLNRAEKSLELRSKGYERSIKFARAPLDVADSVLGEVSDALVTVRERALQASNAALSPEDRAAMSVEVDRIREAIVGLANTQVGDRYIFSGLTDDVPTVDDVGGVIDNSLVRQVEVSPGVRVEAGVAGAEVFGGLGGGVNMMAVLEDFSVALQNDDLAGIQNALVEIDAAFEQVITARTQLGSNGEAFEIALRVNEENSFRSQVRQSELVETDPSESISRYQRANLAYQTAIEIASQLPPPGLVSRG